jgi:hypothetical protein
LTKRLFFLFALSCSLGMGAQADAYHQQITTQYTLTGVSYPIADSEKEIYTTTYGWTASMPLSTKMI